MHDFLDLFYPRICAACHRILTHEESDICLFCAHSLPKTNFHLLEDNPVEKLFWGRIDVVKATSCYYFTKHGKIQNLLHNIKYNGYKELASKIGHSFGKEIASSGIFRDIDFIVPVPLHPKKLKIRGYNQSEYFGKGLAESIGKPLSVNNLIRTTHSPTQTHKTRFQRWLNVSDIFYVNEPDQYSGMHILLIDDVVTTGATIEAAYHVMKDLNIRFSVATIAFAST
jgi:ComF family protein